MNFRYLKFIKVGNNDWRLSGTEMRKKIILTAFLKFFDYFDYKFLKTFAKIFIF